MTTIDARATLSHATLPASIPRPRPVLEALTAPAAFLVLAGGLRPSPLAAACGRSVLDLALTPRQTVMELWMDRLAELACVGPLPQMRIVHTRQSFAPTPPAPGRMVALQIEREPHEYRGPAGVARDACERYSPDSTILLVEAARCYTGSLVALLRDHHESGAAVTVGCNRDMSPAGVYALHRSALDLVPRAGFLDLKEQWLRRLVASGMDVRVHILEHGASYALRSLPHFINAAGELNRFGGPEVAGGCSRLSGASEAREPFQVIRPGALIDPSATVIDSVVMEGARIGPRALIARSLICPGAVVHAESEVIDTVAAPINPPVPPRARRHRHPNLPA